MQLVAWAAQALIWLAALNGGQLCREGHLSTWESSQHRRYFV
jgi:hypothetical protein